ncbi:Zn(2)-Cys(6) zinc finger domain protein [Alternaria alternata]|nr:Zn(2)-Cys(6) zinc finger domain protein [Alternaria alternata]
MESSDARSSGASKQAHRKVRTGCTVCRERRIKCDELRPACDVGQSSTRIAATLHSHGDARLKVCAQPLPVPRSLSFPWPVPTTEIEQRLLSRVHYAYQDLSTTGISEHFTGCNHFSRYSICPAGRQYPGIWLLANYISLMAMAAHNEPLRNSLYSIGAASLLPVTHDSSLRAAEIHYRLKAIDGMQATIRELGVRCYSVEEMSNVRQGLLGCARLLSWYAPDKYRCARLNTRYRNDFITDQTRQLDRSLSQRDPETIDPKMQNFQSPSKPDQVPETQGHQLLDQLQRSTHYLARRCKDDEELRAAVTELGCLVSNFRHFSLQYSSLEDALGTMYAARSWLRFVPNATSRLAARDPLVILVLAHWELLTYIMLTMVSCDVRALSMQERERSVINLLRCLSDASLLQQQPINAVNVRIANQHNKARLKWVAIAELSLQSCGANTTPQPGMVSNEHTC